MYRVIVIATPQTYGGSLVFGGFSFTTEKAALAVTRWLVRWPGVNALTVYDGWHSKSYRPGDALYETACTESAPC